MNALRQLLGMLTIDHILADFVKARARLLKLVDHHHSERDEYLELSARHKATAADHAADADRAMRVATKLTELVS